MAFVSCYMRKGAKQSFTISGPAATLLQNEIGEQLLGFCPTGYVGQACPSIAMAKKLNEVYEALSGSEHPYWAAFKNHEAMEERSRSLNGRCTEPIVAATLDAPKPAIPRTDPVTFSLSNAGVEFLSSELTYRMRGFDSVGYAGIFCPTKANAELLNEAYRALTGEDHQNWIENKDHPGMDECAELNNSQRPPKYQRGATHGTIPEHPEAGSNVVLALPSELCLAGSSKGKGGR